MVSTPFAAAASTPYARVKQHLKEGLSSGRWPPGALMPSEAELVARFGVSRMTVSRALRQLQAERLVTRTQGVGTFAAPLHRVSSTLTIRDLHEEIEKVRDVFDLGDSLLIVAGHKLGWNRFMTYNLTGPRFHGVGLGPDTAGVRIDLYDSSGDYEASGIDGLEMHIHGNAQD